MEERESQVGSVPVDRAHDLVGVDGHRLLYGVFPRLELVVHGDLLPVLAAGGRWHRRDTLRNGNTPYRRTLRALGCEFHARQLIVSGQDRKSTRLNSSHMSISYAV